MTALRVPHLTVLAVDALPEHAATGAAFFRSAKLTPKASLATATQSCILDLHSIRRLNKLPKKTA
jgi:hypothetical protein